MPPLRVARRALGWFLFGRVSRSTLSGEALLVGILFVLFLGLEVNLLAGRVTYLHDSILWYPMFHYFAESLWQGVWPLWNPYVHGGEPFHYAWGILRLLDPVTLASIGAGKLLNAPLLDLYHYNYLLRILVTMLGVYALLRHLVRHFLSAYVGLIVGLWGYLGSVSLSVVGNLDAFCWFPWALLFLLRAIAPQDPGRRAALIGFAYVTGLLVGASIYHWAYGAFALAGFGISLLVGRRADLRRLTLIPRRVWLGAAVLFLVLSAPLIALVPERPGIVPAVRLYDRDREVGWLGRILGVDYRDIEARSDQVGLGSYAFVRNLVRWVPKYESPETSFVARLLFLLGLVFGRHRYKYHLLTTGALLVFLYAGPVLPLGWLHKILYFAFPPLWLARHLSIFDPFIYLFILVFVALGTDRVLAWLAPREDRVPTPGDTGSTLRYAMGAGAVVTGAAVFTWAWPLRTGLLQALHGPAAPGTLLVTLVACWAVAAWALRRFAERPLGVLVVVVGLSVLAVEQWGIGESFQGPVKLPWARQGGCACAKQSQKEYFSGSDFPKRAVKTFTLPGPRVPGLDWPKSYLSYGPTLLKVNTVLEDLLPPLSRGDHVLPAAFDTRFPMGLYHFWPREYFRLYEIGEIRPTVFASLMGIGAPALEFYPGFVLMTERRQEMRFLIDDPDVVRDALDRAVFLPRWPRRPFAALSVALRAAAPVRASWNGSFEEWDRDGVPAQWTPAPGTVVARVERPTDPDHVREGSRAVRLGGAPRAGRIEHSLRLEPLRGKDAVAHAWVKSASAAPGAVRLQLRGGAPVRVLGEAAYSRIGHWQELTVRAPIGPEDAAVTVVLEVLPAAEAPAYFDDVRVLASAPLSPAPGRARVVSYAPSRLELAVESDANGILLFRDTYHPSWRARVDGKPRRIERADLAFKAIPVEKGAHTVVLEYRPVGFLLALYGYLLANALVLVMAVGWLWRWARRPLSDGTAQEPGHGVAERLL